MDVVVFIDSLYEESFETFNKRLGEDLKRFSGSEVNFTTEVNLVRVNPWWPGLRLSDEDMRDLKKKRISTVLHVEEYGASGGVDAIFSANRSRNIVRLLSDLKIGHINYITDVPEDTRLKRKKPDHSGECIIRSVFIDTCITRKIPFNIIHIPIVVDNLGLQDYTTPFYSFFSEIDNFIYRVHDRVDSLYDQHDLNIQAPWEKPMNAILLDELVDKVFSMLLSHGRESKNKTVESRQFIFLLKTCLLSRLQGFVKPYSGDENGLTPVDLMLEAQISHVKKGLNLHGLSYDREMADSSEINAGDSVSDFLKWKKKQSMAYKEFSEELMKNSEKRYLKLRDGFHISYYRIGNGPAIVFLNAVGVDSKIWEKVISLLCKDYSIIAFESRGVYEEIQEDGIESGIRDLTEIFKHESINRACFVGWCSGAKLALFFQDRYPEMVESLILIGGRYTGFAAKKETAMYNTVMDIYETLQEQPEAIKIYMRLLNNLMSKSVVKEQDYSNYIQTIDIFSKVNSEYQEQVLKPFSHELYFGNYIKLLYENYTLSVSEILPKIDVPILLIHGDHDMTVPVKQVSWFMDRHDRTRCVIVPGGTHFLPFENHRQIATLIDGLNASISN